MDFEDYFISLNNLDLNKEIIERAYNIAMTKHSGQLRKISGLDYIIHPIAVSRLLAEFDTEVVAAALLHDLLEDTNTNKSELRSAFGDSITNLVVGMTKLKDKDIFTPLERIGKKDPRVFLIKLADRLDNLSDGIFNMKLSTKKKYLTETPKIIKMAKYYGIINFVEDITKILESLFEQMNTKN